MKADSLICTLILSTDEEVEVHNVSFLQVVDIMQPGDTAAQFAARLATVMCYIDEEPVSEDWLWELRDEDAARVMHVMSKRVDQLNHVLKPLG